MLAESGPALSFLFSPLFLSRCLAIALLTLASPAIALDIDLGDIIGGGDGTGTGAAQGIDTQTGLVATMPVTTFGGTPNQFFSTANPYIDGVFVPDGGVLNDEIITASTTGITVTGISDAFPFAGAITIQKLWNGDDCSTFCIPNIPGVKVMARGNHGVTFDLDAIEAMHGDEALVLDLHAINGDPADVLVPSILGSFHIFVDGVEIDSVNLAFNSQFFFPTIYLDPADRFVTLVTGSQGAVNGDFQYWNDPVIKLPEPAFGTGLLVCAAALVPAIRSRRDRARSRGERSRDGPGSC